MALYDPELGEDGLPVDICPGEDVELGNNDCVGATRIEWTQRQGPAASQFNFNSDNQPIITGSGPVAGRYTLRRCCFYETEGATQPVETQPGLTCPEAAMVGDLVSINLAGCDGIADWTVTGSALLTAVNNQVAYVSANDAGTYTVEVTCNNANGSSFGYQCEIVFYPDTQQFTTTTSEVAVITAVECGEFCTCEDVDIIIGCDSPNQENVKTPVFFEEILPLAEKPVIEVLTPVRMTGNPLPALTCNDVIEKPCEEDLCCDQHVPAIIWNDVANCGWTIESTQEVNGTSAYGAFGNNAGGKLCFTGAVTITLSGPPAFIDTLVLYGHNMTNATITTSPLVPFGGGPATTGVVSDKSCLEGYTNPVIVYFNEVNDNITELTVTITPDDPTKTVCIQQIVAGRKLLDLWPNGLPDTWQNPFLGGSREIRIREGNCGITSVTSKRKRASLSIPVECISESVYKECVMPLIRYLECPNPLLFAWSINRCPQDLFYGYLTGLVNPVSYEDGFEPIQSLEFEGYIRQPQSKEFA